MIEVPLVKRLLVLTLIALLAVGAVGCTREKPSEPTTPIALQIVTPIPATTPTTATAPLSPAPSPTTPVPIAPAPTDTPLPPLPTITPSAPTPTQTSPTPSAPGTYTVQWGDWLNKIATQFGVPPQAIIAANPGLNPNVIYPGQVLKIPEAGAPVPTPAGAPAPSPSGGPTTYTVQRGDWLYAIARKFGISVAALQAANPSLNPNFVYPGQVLNIPSSTPPMPGPTPAPGPTTTYIVQRGDTLYAIAIRFRTTPYAIQIANRLASPNFIYPGQVLIIPQ